MGKKKNIRQQLRNELHRQFKDARGRSRHVDKKQRETHAIHDRIYGRASLKTHLSRIDQLEKWLKQQHPEVHNLNQISRDLVGEYLKFQEDRGRSAWTVSADIAAINHVMIGSGKWDKSISKSDYGLRQRRQQEIKNNRGETRWKQEGRGSESTYEKELEYGRAFGLRRSELVGNNSQHARASTASLYRTPDGRLHNVTIGKGGRYRTSECLASYQKIVEERYKPYIQNVTVLPDRETFLERYKDSEDFFKSISRSVRIHHECRQYYAEEKLKELQRENRCQSGQNFKCNNVLLDKGQALFVSNQLGHNRLDVLKSYVGLE